MITTTALGNLSLNISFFLYLIVYLPQIQHNRKPAHLKQLSLTLHIMIIASFLLDYAYSVLLPLPWQYQTVAIIALSLLGIQHIQLMQLAWRNKHLKRFLGLNVFLYIILFALIYFFYLGPTHYSRNMILFIGYIARIGFLIYVLPQIIQNYRMRSAKALNPLFLKLSLFLSSLDLISAWCLNWGWPNKLGTPLNILLTLILLWQMKHYRDSTIKTPTLLFWHKIHKSA
jgi:uncharacterized protein with PQ loop repeat